MQPNQVGDLTRFFLSKTTLIYERSERQKRSNRVAVRDAAKQALLQLLEPLTEFVLDSGLSIHELSSILREAAVRSIAARQLETAPRVNISGIAASTGIARGEISRILKSGSIQSSKASNGHQQSTIRVVEGWLRDPRFRAASKPSDLKIYGRGPTFDRLVRTYGRGIPTRALLEELVRSGVIEVRSSQVVHLNTSASNPGMNPQMIMAFGDRATELFSTMLQNIRRPETSAFVASVSGKKKIAADSIRAIREELSSKAATFLDDIRYTLNRQPEKNATSGASSKAIQLSLTIYCHEAIANINSKRLPYAARRNFRRIR
jgi:hypothetical protein